MGAVTIIQPRPMLAQAVGCGQLYHSDGYRAPCIGCEVIPLNGDESIKLTSKKLLVGINAG